MIFIFLIFVLSFFFLVYFTNNIVKSLKNPYIRQHKILRRKQRFFNKYVKWAYSKNESMIFEPDELTKIENKRSKKIKDAF